MPLPKYIVATKTVRYVVSDILEDNDIDINTVAPVDLLEYIEETLITDFGYEEPNPTITFEE